MSVRTRILIAMLGLLIAPALLAAQEKPLASTPPMGWNSWNKFGCNVSEDLIRQMADAMAKSGMKDAGYQYVVIDDCWQVERDARRQHRGRPEAISRGDQGTGGLRSFSRPEVRHLFRCRQHDLRTSARAVSATNIRMRCSTPPGVSTT